MRSKKTGAEAATLRIGPDLVFGRVWEQLGIQAELHALLKKRQFEFDVERAIYLTVLHRLFVSGSDRAAEKWREGYRISGTESLELHHLYRAMAILGEELPAREQEGRTPFSPRCMKDVLEASPRVQEICDLTFLRAPAGQARDDVLPVSGSYPNSFRW